MTRAERVAEFNDLCEALYCRYLEGKVTGDEHDAQYRKLFWDYYDDIVNTSEAS